MPSNKNVFRDIDTFWSKQKNNEIFLRGKDVEFLSEEYWKIIENSRERVIYYRPQVLEWLRNGIGPKLLEIGCGMGVDSGYFYANGFSVTGIDLASEHIQLAKRYFEYKKYKGQFTKANAE
jgi:2-polyprenyl-3-methyl-5-hydroxy-6-metoxy-1,4-benzoquinol methylase